MKKFTFKMTSYYSLISQSETVMAPSASLTEAALLIQSRKSDDDVETICEICPSLTPSQILKLIKSYTSDDFEDSISPTFIDKLTKKLNAVSFKYFQICLGIFFKSLLLKIARERIIYHERE